MGKRIDELDYLRGFALLGILLVNILPLLDVNIPEAHSANAGYQIFLYLFVEGRFFTIFSFLFGVGFYLFLTRANEKGRNGYVLLIRRLAILLLMGIFHSIYHPGEALLIYAICGFITLPFFLLHRYINLTISLALLLFFGLTGSKIGLVLPLILLGLTCGQYRVFENLAQKKKKVAIYTVIMFVLSVIGLSIQYALVPSQPFVPFLFMLDADGHLDRASQFMQMGITVGPILSAFYIGLLILILQNERVRKWLSPLRLYGRMALTNYIGQTLLILTAGNIFELMSELSYIGSLLVCFVIYIIGLGFSFIWLRYFKMGPLEWIWRMITYWEFIPLTKAVHRKEASDK